MKWKNKVKRTATTTSAIILALMLAACSDSNNNNNPIAPSATPDTEQSEQGNIPTDTLPEDTGALDPGTLNPDDTATGGNNTSGGNNNASGGTNTPVPGDTESDAKQAEGVYVGAADNHTLEIKIGNDFRTFQIDDSFAYVIDEFDSDQAVSIEYVEKNIDGITQDWITKIEKK